jgi:predicted permease
MALKKSENAMINNLLRNVLVPILVFYLAKYLSADFNSFFWLWATFQWSLSLLLLIFVIYFMKFRLEKSRAVVNP